MSITLQNISKRFTERTWRTALLHKKPKTTRALNNVSFSVRPGEIFGLLGPNGAGKTTLIKILATLILPDAGKAEVCGRDLAAQAQQVRRKIGVVNTSERSFYWRLTGRQNLSFFASLWDLSGSQQKQRVDQMLRLVELTDKADIPFMKYSSGQQQRLALARALLPEPQVLLMDEPTRSLDPLSAAELRQFIKNDLMANRQKTILWCTHNLKEAETVCDRMAILHKGQVIAAGDMTQMRAIFTNRSRFTLKIDRLPKDHQLQPTTNTHVIHNNGYIKLSITAKETSIPKIIKTLVEQGIQVYACQSKEADLEEIFENLIKSQTKIRV